MPDIDAIKAAQVRVACLQAALDTLLCSNKRSGLEASTGAGLNRVGFFKPEIAKAQAEVARLSGDRSAMRRAFTL